MEVVDNLGENVCLVDVVDCVEFEVFVCIFVVEYGFDDVLKVG